MTAIKLVKAIDVATSTTTSSEINVKGASKITILFTRANHSAGSTTFDITGSIDGTTFATINFIDYVANTNAQTLTRVASKVLNSNTAVWCAVEASLIGLDKIKITATRATDGTSSAYALIEF